MWPNSKKIFDQSRFVLDEDWFGKHCHRLLKTKQSRHGPQLLRLLISKSGDLYLAKPFCLFNFLYLIKNVFRRARDVIKNILGKDLTFAILHINTDLQVRINVWTKSLAPQTILPPTSTLTSSLTPLKSPLTPPPTTHQRTFIVPYRVPCFAGGENVWTSKGARKRGFSSIFTIFFIFLLKFVDQFAIFAQFLQFVMFWGSWLPNKKFCWNVQHTHNVLCVS